MMTAALKDNFMKPTLAKLLISFALLTNSPSSLSAEDEAVDAMSKKVESIFNDQQSEIPDVEKITIDRIHSSPSLQGFTAKSLKFSPDGSRITYLQGKIEDHNTYDLWEYHIATKKHQLLVDAQSIFNGLQNLSAEEKSRRERQRVYGEGILEYHFSHDGKALLFPLNGDVYYYLISSKQSKRLTSTIAFETDLKFSPQNHFVSYIREKNLYIYNLKTGSEQQLTKNGTGVIKNGMSEFVAQEEMDRHTGYWWSDDEKHIAFLRVDESAVMKVVHNEIYSEKIALVEQRYPRAGTSNVLIELAVIDLKSNKIRLVDTGKNKDIYIPRVKWLPDSKNLSYQLQSRDQQTLTLFSYNIRKRRSKSILVEQSEHWLNLHKDLSFLNNNKGFIWASERDGYKHLYHYSVSGEQISQLTKGNWSVDSLTHVDEKNNWIYFTGRADTPIEKHLYRVPLTGSSPENVQRISKRNGIHNIQFSMKSGEYIDNFSNIKTPAQISLHKANGQHVSWIAENKITAEHPLSPYYNDLVFPEFGTLTADDGETDLFYKLYKPTDLQPGKEYPVIIQVYGGPLAQRVTNKWHGADLTQYLVQQGYIVFQLDNRGSSNRGTAFETPIYKTLGQIEVDDQITGARFLQTLPFIDKKRIGIYGHSYGGYIALMAMFKAGDYFSAGVSGAPVTDWLLYDTHYTERYLGLPKDNEVGYQDSSVYPFVSGLESPLLIYHGMADDNVLFTHTTKLIKALQDNGKLFELMTYPGSKHSMRGKAVQVHLDKTIVSFFDRHFK